MAQSGADTASLSAELLDALPAHVALLDADGTVLHANAGWERAAARGGPVTVPVGGNYLAAAEAGDGSARAVAAGVRSVLDGLAGVFRRDHLHHPVSGPPSWLQVTATPAGEAGRAVVVHLDVTDRVAAERRATFLAAHDHLTRLPNRAALYEVIAEAMADRPGRAVTVLYLDVDGFKRVNDLLGHAAGDALLQELAGRLAARSRPDDVVGRLGGDEFVVVARDCDAAGGAALAARFRAAFDDPFDLHGSQAVLTPSIGIATCQPGHASPADLLADADIAMYAAKARGPDRCLAFAPEMRAWLQERLRPSWGGVPARLAPEH